MVTAEWLRTVASAVPALLLAWWALWLVGWAWRQTLWQRVGSTAQALAGSEGRVLAVWAGWRVVTAGQQITWRGGPMGVHTTVVVRGETHRRSGLLDGDGVFDLTRPQES